MLIQYCASYFITGAALLSIAFFVYTANPSSSVNRIFCLYSLAIAWWSLFSIPAILIENSLIAVFWCRTFIVGAIFIPTLFFHFVVEFVAAENSTRKSLNRILIYAYVISFVFFFLNFTGLFISSASPKFVLKNYSVPGPVFHAHVFYFIVITAYGVSLLFNKLNDYARNNEYGDKYKQLLYLFWTSLFGYLGGIPNYSLVYNIQIPLINPYGTYAVAIYGGLTAYIIVRYKFLDIEIIIRRTAVFAGLFTFVYGVFTIITVIGQEFFQNSLHWNQWVALIPTALIITFALRPFESWLTNATEKFLFQKKYDYRVLLKTFTNEVLTVLDLQKLTEQTISGLMKIMKLESTCILLLHKDLGLYKTMASSGVKNSKDIVFKETDAVIAYLKETEHHILKDKEAEQMGGYSQLRDDFKKLGAQLCLPISHHDELIGVLGLGMKKSGEEFTQEDLDILTTLSRTLGIAIANAQLFDQLSKTQAEAAQREKMAVIGTLAAGINHEICNPLGIVRGQCEMFLLNLRDGLYDDNNKEQICHIASDIMNKVIKETDRATGITKKLSGFAKPAKKTESEEVLVEKEADEVLGLIGHDLKLNNIKFSKNFSPDFPPIFADKRQIQEVLFNIIRNAAQAMDKKDGRIELSGISTSSSAVVKIVDNGSGIPIDKIGQIFNPFFTTKDPGKGTGLGLFIVKQVIERNKGTISVDSIEGEGTTFTLTFPAAHATKAIAA